MKSIVELDGEEYLLVLDLDIDSAGHLLLEHRSETFAVVWDERDF